jgi:hypothetical protein
MNHARARTRTCAHNTVEGIKALLQVRSECETRFFFFMKKSMRARCVHVKCGSRSSCELDHCLCDGRIDIHFDQVLASLCVFTKLAIFSDISDFRMKISEHSPITPHTASAVIAVQP